MARIMKKSGIVKKVREESSRIVFSREEFEAAESRINKTMQEFRKRERVCGLIIEKSDCCQARIDYTSGGVRIPYCSKCGKHYEEKRF